MTCSKCGKETSVPFTPTPGRPVYCRDCYAAAPQSRPAGGGGGFGGGAGGGGPRRAGPGGGGGGGPRGGTFGRGAPARPTVGRKRMMSQGRKGHFMHDARLVLTETEVPMDANNVRHFLEGLFARGARTSTEAAQDFLDEKLADQTLTRVQRDNLGRLVDRYSMWR